MYGTVHNRTQFCPRRRRREDTVKQCQLFVAGKWIAGESTEILHNKFDETELAEVHVASQGHVRAATEGVSAAQQSDNLSAYERFEILQRASELVRTNAEQFAEAIVLDTGFVWSDAQAEVGRAVQTLLLSAEEAKRITGEIVPMSSAPGGGDRLGFTVRHPRGVVCAITPFNSPLNTVAHKVGPALASGNGVVLKPSTYTPLSSDLLVRTLLEAGLPEGLISLLHGSGATVGHWLLEDKIPDFYAFTGSTAVGEHIRRTVGLRPAQLELGSLSSTIVCEDANLEACVPKVVAGSFRKAGQVCTSIQRIFVQEGLADEFVQELKTSLSGRTAGDPLEKTSFIGPVISHEDAERIQSSIDTAISDGGQLVLGGESTGGIVQPTLLTHVSPEMGVMNREIFGPVVSVRVFKEFDRALDEVNDTPFGLSAGIFTNDLDRAMSGARRLRMGSVHINETSSSRVDLMPFGGVKASGSGKEGPHYAIAEMTEERLVTIGPHA